MVAGSLRVRRIVELVTELTDEERSELQAELAGEETAVERAWGEEIDRRAARALRGEAGALSRPQLAALLDAEPMAARARLAEVLSLRR